MSSTIDVVTLHMIPLRKLEVVNPPINFVQAVILYQNLFVTVFRVFYASVYKVLCSHVYFSHGNKFHHLRKKRTCNACSMRGI